MKTSLNRKCTPVVRALIRGSFFLVALLLATTFRLAATDLAVTGNLTVSANATVSGNTTLSNDLDAGWGWVTLTGTEQPGNSGNWLHYNLDLSDINTTAGSTTYVVPGLNLGVVNGTEEDVVFTGYSQNTTWTWQHGLINDVGGDLFFNGTPTLQMNLTDAGVMTVVSAFDANAPATNITLDPSNQTITLNKYGSAAISLTRSGSTLIFNNNSIAIGTGTSTGSGAFALGNNSLANGSGSMALIAGNISSAGTGAFAVGTNSTVSAVGAIALGGGNASANGTFVEGVNSTANATGAVALGTGVSAATWSSVTVGHYNTAITGNNSAYVSTDPAFIVGIGQNSTATANGLAIYNNGNTTIGGNSTTTTVNGNVTILIPQGDIPMGEFGD